MDPLRSYLEAMIRDGHFGFHCPSIFNRVETDKAPPLFLESSYLLWIRCFLVPLLSVEVCSSHTPVYLGLIECANFGDTFELRSKK